MENETALSVAALVNAIIAWLSAALAAFQAGVLPPERERMARVGDKPTRPGTVSTGWRWWPSPHPFAWLGGGLPNPASLFGAVRGASRADDVAPPAEASAPLAENPAGPGWPAQERSARASVTHARNPTLASPGGVPAIDTGAAALSMWASIGVDFRRDGPVVPADGQRVFPRNEAPGRPNEFSNCAFANAIFCVQFVTNTQ